MVAGTVQARTQAAAERLEAAPLQADEKDAEGLPTTACMAEGATRMFIEIMTPAQAREALELLGGEIVLEYGPNGRVDDVLRWDSSGRGRFVWYVYGIGQDIGYQSTIAACIVQVALEQVVRERDQPILIAHEHGERLWFADDKWFPTYHEALLAAGRAVKESADAE